MDAIFNQVPVILSAVVLVPFAIVIWKVYTK